MCPAPAVRARVCCGRVYRRSSWLPGCSAHSVSLPLLRACPPPASRHTAPPCCYCHPKQTTPTQWRARSRSSLSRASAAGAGSPSPWRTAAREPAAARALHAAAAREVLCAACLYVLLSQLLASAITELEHLQGRSCKSIVIVHAMAGQVKWIERSRSWQVTLSRMCSGISRQAGRDRWQGRWVGGGLTKAPQRRSDRCWS